MIVEEKLIKGNHIFQGSKANPFLAPRAAFLWSDGRRLVVADAWNHRVLIWHDFPGRHGQEADVVVGQPDFNSNLPNVEGIGKAPSAKTLNWPYGVFSDGQSLWIADTGNHRVVFNRLNF